MKGVLMEKYLDYLLECLLKDSVLDSVMDYVCEILLPYLWRLMTDW